MRTVNSVKDVMKAHEAALRLERCAKLIDYYNRYNDGAYTRVYLGTNNAEIYLPADRIKDLIKEEEQKIRRESGIWG